MGQYQCGRMEVEGVPGLSLYDYTGAEPDIYFFIIRGANYANLYKNLIKIQIFNVNLGARGGQAPARPPVYLSRRRLRHSCSSFFPLQVLLSRYVHHLLVSSESNCVDRLMLMAHHFFIYL